MDLKQRLDEKTERTMKQNHEGKLTEQESFLLIAGLTFY